MQRSEPRFVVSRTDTTRVDPGEAPIRILIVEDSEDDALLIARELRRAGYVFAERRVETREAFGAALDADEWDVIISDYRLHGSTGLDALRMMQERGLDIPFILISGVMGEDVAVEAMKAGCHDYLMKGHLMRLGPAIEREMREAEVRRERARLHAAVQRHASILEDQVRLRTAELQASEARFRAVFEESAIGIALTDPDGRILMSNPALEALLDHDPQMLQEATIADLIAPPEQPHDPRARAQRYEGAFVRSDGSDGTAEVVVSAVYGEASAVHAGCGRPDGEVPAYYIWMVDDVTEARTAQAALIQAEKLDVTGRLAASLVHEIRNPLQAVIGCIQLAREAATSGEDTSRYLDVASRELLRIDRLLTRLRDLNRRSELQKRTHVDVNVLLECVETLVARKARDQDVLIEMCLAEDLPPLSLAVDAVQQVFLNLALNALDAMPDGGTLRITTDRVPGGVRIRLVDTGDGIPTDIVPHLFDPFLTSKQEGLGLGLYVCRGIVTEHGGSIDVESTGHAGTALTVFLPE